ncbi:MAG: hypothetical protein GY754_01470 [bacterium]|nr:hypothetical protein [bacterium]
MNLSKKTLLGLFLTGLISFYGCEAGLTSNDGSSGGDSDEKFSFSEIYNKLKSMQEEINSLNITIEVLSGGTSSTITEIESRLTGLEAGSVLLTRQNPPVGTILAWHKSLTHTPQLPEGWVECGGQTITDGESVYDGGTVPNLNGEARFLRGSTSSGFIQNHQMQGHTHTDSGHGHTDSGHAHTVQMGNNTNSGPDIWLMHSDTAEGSWGQHTSSTGYANIQAGYAAISNPVNSGYGDPLIGTETRPANMSVVWIIRIK